ncbi:hypothetical protein SI65_08248 [Aspergillus cristatus]|uniref:ribonuclease Z n=1 Tax=Aspergillus cristatus TaxID=573508 RepID=A0A1E3B5M9_ASPCR|nr:hypothetical protein SI65_08248 [Aspergillus cristatus]
MVTWCASRLPSAVKASFSPAKLASLRRTGRLFSQASRGYFFPQTPRSFSAAAILLAKSKNKTTFRPFVSEPQWPRLLHFERTPAIPNAYVIRAPRSESRRLFRSSNNNYVIYQPDSCTLNGFDHKKPSPLGIAPMKFYYQVLTTPTGDTPGTTLLLHFPDKRYFFGHLSEGTQRACTERGVKLTYLTDAFLTGRTEWANNGGLIGTILTQADGLINSNLAQETAAQAKGLTAEQKKHGVPYAEKDGQVVAQRGSLTIHGGRNITHSLATARRFVFRKGMPVFMREYDSETLGKRRLAAKNGDAFEEPSWFDNNIKVWAMPVSPSGQDGSEALQSGQQSPRKRSLDEFQEKEDGVDMRDRRLREQILRQSVVTDMFNSSWRMDALIETPLAEVKMPASMFIRNPETKQLEQYMGPAPGSNQPLPDIKVLVRQPWPGATVEKLPPTTWCDEALSYVVRNHDVRGKFDPKKAEELKIRKGPDYARLTKGESVESMDGKTVTPEMVLGPPRPGKGLAIIDLPSVEYVENLVNRPEWSSPAVTTDLEAFLWILGPGVGDHPKLREFVEKRPNAKHIVSSTDYCPNYLALPSVAGSSIRLARLKGDSYSIPFHDNVTLPQPGTPTHGSEVTKQSVQTSPFEPSEPGLVIGMEPKFEINRSEVMQRLNPAEVVNKIPRAVEKRVDTIRKRMQKQEFRNKLESVRKDLPGQDVEIIALGTGSSAPSKYRNVSATLLRVPGYGYYMLDCGENTLGQLKRVYNPEELREVLRNLRMIWISHLHADHHLGTASLIKAWYQENYPEGVPSQGQYIEDDVSKILDEKRLFVLSEESMISWLEEYAAVEDYGFSKTVPLSAYPYMDENKRILTSFVYRHTRADGSYPGQMRDVGKPSNTLLRFDDDNSPLTAQLRAATGLKDFRTTRVSHCRGAMAASLIFPDGFQVSFSGDCRPSQSFAEIGKGSTVLIHEATFQDDMYQSAIAKRHSTTSEALEVGRRMEARTILLTHFSQRYQKVAYVDQKTGAVKHEEAQDTPADADAGGEPETLEDDTPPKSFKDVITLRRPNQHTSRTTRSSVLDRTPTTAVFDYMRVRVGDIPIAQAYNPALEKLFDILERASTEEANQAKKEREEQKTVDSKRGKKKAERQALAQGKQLPMQEVPAADAETGPSVWSANESESGWSTSEPEDEGGK